MYASHERQTELRRTLEETIVGVKLTNGRLPQPIEKVLDIASFSGAVDRVGMATTLVRQPSDTTMCTVTFQQVSDICETAVKSHMNWPRIVRRRDSTTGSGVEALNPSCDCLLSAGSCGSMGAVFCLKFDDTHAKHIDVDLQRCLCTPSNPSPPPNLHLASRCISRDLSPKRPNMFGGLFILAQLK